MSHEGGELATIQPISISVAEGAKGEKVCLHRCLTKSPVGAGLRFRESIHNAIVGCQCHNCFEIALKAGQMDRSEAELRRGDVVIGIHVARNGKGGNNRSRAS